MDDTIDILFRCFQCSPCSPEKHSVTEAVEALAERNDFGQFEEDLLAEYEEVCLKDGFYAGFRMALNLFQKGSLK